MKKVIFLAIVCMLSFAFYEQLSFGMHPKKQETVQRLDEEQLRSTLAQLKMIESKIGTVAVGSRVPNHLIQERGRCLQRIYNIKKRLPEASAEEVIQNLQTKADKQLLRSSL